MTEPKFDEDVFARNCYMIGAKLMQDNIVMMFMSGKSMRDIKKLIPPEPDIPRLRDMEERRLASIAGN